MNLDQISKEYFDYINFCRDAVNSLGVNPNLKGNIDGLNINGIRPFIGASTFKEEYNASSEIEAIILKRQELIDIKVNHTNRVINDIIKVADKIGMNVDFKRVLEVTARLHDIGRFEYATWNNVYGNIYKEQEAKRMFFKDNFVSLNTPLNVKNHSEAGISIIESGKIPSLNESNYSKLIKMAILHHEDPNLVGELNPKNNIIDEKLLHSNIFDNLSKVSTFNEAEIQIYAVLTQLIKDVDCIDILHQHLTGEFPVIRQSAQFKKKGLNALGVEVTMTVAEFADYYGVTLEDILKYNPVSKENENLSFDEKIKLLEERARLNIKLLDDNNKLCINPNSLVVPKDIKEKFFNFKDVDLKPLMARIDYNPITGMWWRLNHFLGNLNLSSNIEVIKESNLLEEIYNKYPEELKPNVKEMFDFSNTHLLNNRGNDIYAEDVLKPDDTKTR